MFARSPLGGALSCAAARQRGILPGYIPTIIVESSCLIAFEDIWRVVCCIFQLDRSQYHQANESRATNINLILSRNA